VRYQLQFDTFRTFPFVGFPLCSDFPFGGSYPLAGVALWSNSPFSQILPVAECPLWSDSPFGLASLFALQLPVEPEQMAKGGSQAGPILPKFAAGKGLQNA